MTHQELIEQNIRMTIGELTVQNVILRSQVASLEAQLQEMLAKDEPQDSPYVPLKNGNGASKEEEAGHG